MTHRKSELGRRDFLKAAGVGTAALAATRFGATAGTPTPHVTRVHHIPVPDYSRSNRHPGVDSLLFALAGDRTFFYKAATPHPLAHPSSGLIAANDVVLIKVNAQWKYRGSTNTDVVRGIIQRILEHPDGFTGEVVIIENGQGRGSLNCDTNAGCDGGTNEVHANAENEGHSFVYLVNNVFMNPQVGQRLLDDIRTTTVAPTDHVTEGYRYVGNASYPCFNTPRGNRVELKQGLWTGIGYDSQRLKWINVPTMKDHKDANVTGNIKHVMGLVTTYNEPLPHSDPYSMGIISGDFYTLVRRPVLCILDHIWVPFASLCGFPASTTTRRDMLCAGFDPVAMDAWSARHILYPISGDPAHDPDVPGYFRTYLLSARDRINANGGLDGVPVTMDEASIVALQQDQRLILMGVVQQGADMKLSWAGGRPPYRVERDRAASFPAPQVLADGTYSTDLTDPGAASGSTNWFYRVSGT